MSCGSLNIKTLGELFILAHGFIDFSPPRWCPSQGHEHGVSILSSINLRGTFRLITHAKNGVPHRTETWISSLFINLMHI